MPYPPQVFSLDGHAYGLTISGVQVVDNVPTDLAPIRWSWPSASTNGDISFTVEDYGTFAFPGGAVIRLTDNVNNELLFSGVLTNRRQRRAVGPWRQTDVTGTGWGFYLDNLPVDSWTSIGSDDGNAVRDIIATFGGPLEPSPRRSASISVFPAATATQTTVRGALDANYAVFDTYSYSFTGYVDNDAIYEWWSGDAEIAAVLGTATSVGDQGSLNPEYLLYEVGAESYKGFAQAFDSGGTALGVVGNSGPSWEAGDPGIVLTAVNLTTAAGDLASEHGYVTSVTFSTIEDTSYRPHMEVTVDDSMLTGGAAETFYVASVSGIIDDRNVIELEVSLGARARSLVQTVAGS